MKKIVIFLWRATIPTLWIFSVLFAFRGGFQFGLVPPPPPGETYPYPWVGMILVSIITGIECAFLYLVLRPSRFTWSLLRVGVAFAVFLILSILVVYTFATDQPGYAYVPGSFTLVLTFLLFILLFITIIITFVNRLSARGWTR
jgi:hypothetical protein